MKVFTINVHSHKTLSVVSTKVVQGWDVTDAAHAAIRATLADGHTLDQHGGLFARVAG